MLWRQVIKKTCLGVQCSVQVHNKLCTAVGWVQNWKKPKWRGFHETPLTLHKLNLENVMK